ncbi:hypothetical protein HDU80_005890 [Chytriomyces hyalinus]|nr:hypothetical protein HDU80_005890 [Chytriomyces hyalinus]
MSSIAFDPVQKQTAIGTKDGRIVVVGSSGERRVVTVGKGSVAAVAFSHGNKELCAILAGENTANDDHVEEENRQQGEKQTGREIAFVNRLTGVVSLGGTGLYASSPPASIPAANNAFLVYSLTNSSLVSVFPSSSCSDSLYTLSQPAAPIYTRISPVDHNLLACVSRETIVFWNLTLKSVVVSTQLPSTAASAAWMHDGSHMIVSQSVGTTLLVYPAPTATSTHPASKIAFFKTVQTTLSNLKEKVHVSNGSFEVHVPLLESLAIPGRVAQIQIHKLAIEDMQFHGAQESHHAIMAWSCPQQNNSVHISIFKCPWSSQAILAETRIDPETISTVALSFENQFDRFKDFSLLYRANNPASVLALSEEGLLRVISYQSATGSWIPLSTHSLNSIMCNHDSILSQYIDPAVHLMTLPRIAAMHVTSSISLSANENATLATVHNQDGSVRLWSMSENGVSQSDSVETIPFGNLVPMESSHDPVRVLWDAESGWLLVSSGPVFSILKKRGASAHMESGHRQAEIGEDDEEEDGVLEDTDLDNVMAELDRVVDQVLDLNRGHERTATDEISRQSSDADTEESDDLARQQEPVESGGVVDTIEGGHARAQSNPALNRIMMPLHKRLSTLQMRDLEADTPPSEPVPLDTVVKNNTAMVSLLNHSSHHEPWIVRWKPVAQVMAASVIQAEAVCPELRLAAFATMGTGILTVIDLDSGVAVLETSVQQFSKVDGVALMDFGNTYFPKDSKLAPVLLIATAENAIHAIKITISNTSSTSRKISFSHPTALLSPSSRSSKPFTLPRHASSSSTSLPFLMTLLNEDGENIPRRMNTDTASKEHYLVFVSRIGIHVLLLSRGKACVTLIEQFHDGPAMQSDSADAANSVFGWMGRIFKPPSQQEISPSGSRDAVASFQWTGEVVAGGIVRLGGSRGAPAAPAVLLVDACANVKLVSLPELEVVIGGKSLLAEGESVYQGLKRGNVHVLEEGGVAMSSDGNVFEVSHAWDETWKPRQEPRRLYDHVKQNAFWEKFGKLGDGKDRDLEAILKSIPPKPTGKTQHHHPQSTGNPSPSSAASSSSSRTDAAIAASGGGNDVFNDARNKLNERGELLSNMERKFGDLSESSGNFLKTIQEYNERQSKKKWYEL